MPRVLYQTRAEPLPTMPEATTADRWFRVFSEPVRGCPSLLPGAVPNAAAPAAPVAPRPPAPPLSWFRPLAEPAGLLAPRLLPAAAYPFDAREELPLDSPSPPPPAARPVAPAVDRVSRSPGRRRLLQTAGRLRKLP